MQPKHSQYVARVDASEVIGVDGGELICVPYPLARATPTHNDVVHVVVFGLRTVRRIIVRGDRIVLRSDLASDGDEVALEHVTILGLALGTWRSEHVEKE